MQNYQYKPLKNMPLPSGACFVALEYHLRTVNAHSPAIEVMTDLTRVPAATISPDVSLPDANQAMIQHGVRMLLVTEGEHQMRGLVTATDVLGEKPVQVAQEKRIKRNELLVQDIMTPLAAIEVLSMADIERAEVGHIVATLKTAGRQHALVVQPNNEGRCMLRGIFSASQIARQLGIQLHDHEMARTFAEIEAAMSGI